LRVPRILVRPNGERPNLIRRPAVDDGRRITIRQRRTCSTSTIPDAPLTALS
jgi:hypothetical protein